MADFYAPNFVDLNAGKAISVRKWGGRIKCARDSTTQESSITIGDVYRFFRVHKLWVPVHIWLLSQNNASASDWDCKLYDTVANGGAAVATFATSVSITPAITEPQDLLHEGNSLANYGKSFEDFAGSNSSKDTFDVGLQSVDGGSGGVVFCLQLEYLDGS